MCPAGSFWVDVGVIGTWKEGDGEHIDGKLRTGSKIVCIAKNMLATTKIVHPKIEEGQTERSM